MNKRTTIKKNLVSVVVPVYNTEKYLSKCVIELVNQSYPNKEIILVDDGSEKKCADLCDSIADEYDIVRVIHKKNGGVSSARNAGVEKAIGKYLYFCDSDDIPASNLLEELVSNIEDSNCDLCACNYIRFKNDKEIFFTNGKERKTIYGNERMDAIICDNRYGGYLWNKIFSKEIIDKYNLRFDETLDIIEDALFVLQYISKTYSMVILDECLYAYRDNEFSVTNSSISKKTITATKGQEKVFELLVSVNAPMHLQKWVWKRLMQAIVVSYKKIFFSRMEIRDKWLVILKDMFKNYKSRFNIWREFSNKEILYCFFLEIT